MTTALLLKLRLRGKRVAILIHARNLIFYISGLTDARNCSYLFYFVLFVNNFRDNYTLSLKCTIYQRERASVACGRSAVRQRNET